MAQLSTSLVNVGLTPNDGTGDNIRNAFIITNENVAALTRFLQVAPTFENMEITGVVSGDTIKGRVGIFTEQLTVPSHRASTSTTTGALTVSGGAGISGDLNVGGRINGEVYSNNVVAGALMVTGGAGIAGALQARSIAVDTDVVINGKLTVHGNIISVTTSEFKVVDPIIEIGGGMTQSGASTPLTSDDGFDRGLKFYYYNIPTAEERTGFIGFRTSDDKFIFSANTKSSTLGTAVFETVESNVHSTGTSVFNSITANTISVTDSIFGNIKTAAQPGITSVGTLSSLKVNGNVTVTNGDINVNGNMIYVDGVAVALSSQAFTGGLVPNSTMFASTEASSSANTGAVRIVGGLGVGGDVHITGSLSTAAFNATTLGGTIITANQPNITALGTLGNLAVANGITASSASVNDVIVAQSLSASTLTATTGIGGLLTTPNQSNITSLGNLSNLTVDGNVVISGSNISAPTSHATFNQVTANIVGNIAGSATTVTAAAQPTITSIGTLTSLNVDGLATVGNLSAGNGSISTSGEITTTTNVRAASLYGKIMDGNQDNIDKVGQLSSLEVMGQTTLYSPVSIGGMLTVANSVSVAGTVTATNFVGNFTGGSSSILGQANSATITASSDNIPNEIVLRDSTGSFLAGNITATSFNGPLAGNVTGNVFGNLTGNVAGTATSIIGQENSATINATPYTSPNTIILRDNDSNFFANTSITNVTVANVIVATDGIVIKGTWLEGLNATATLKKIVCPEIVGNVTGSANTVTNASQPAITSVGTLTGLTVTAPIVGSVAGSASKLTTSRTIQLTGDVVGSVEFDGSSNVTIITTSSSNAVALGSGTTGNYIAAGSVSGYGLSGSSNSEGGSFVVTSNATSNNVVSTIVYRDEFGNFAANNITGSVTGDVTGSAATVTAAAQPAITSVGTLTSLTTSGAVTVGTNLTVNGNVTVNGTTTTINAATLEITDKNITLANGSLTAAAANGAGLTVEGAAATLLYASADDSWNFNKKLSATSFYGSGAGLTAIPNTATTATSANTASTIVVRDASGNFSAGVITATLVGNATTASDVAGGAANQILYQSAANTTAYIAAGTTGQILTATTGAAPTWTTHVDVDSIACAGVGISVNQATGAVTLTSNATSLNTASTIVARDASGNFSANIIDATASEARYADLAEMYQSDAQYDPGTVLVFGGTYEVTTTGHQADVSVAGVVSTAPAYLMNRDAKRAVAVALRGKVPVKVTGPVRKGDLLVTSYVPGYAVSIGTDASVPSVAIFAKSLEEDLTEGQKIINAVII